MFYDNDISAYQRLVDDSREVFPHRYFLTTVFESWDIVDRLQKPIERIAKTDAEVLARYSKSHLMPLIGVNDDRRRKCHYHTILLSEKPLNFDALNKFDDGRSMDVRDYDGRRDCLVYTGRKHLPYYGTEVIHPRRKKSCLGANCIHHRCLAPLIPR